MRLILSGHPDAIRRHLEAALACLDNGTAMIWSVEDVSRSYFEGSPPLRVVEFIADASEGLTPHDELAVEVC
jgi:ethanolamine utilization microcompartment shell protein EutL